MCVFVCAIEGARLCVHGLQRVLVNWGPNYGKIRQRAVSFTGRASTASFSRSFLGLDFRILQRLSFLSLAWGWRVEYKIMSLATYVLEVNFWFLLCDVKSWNNRSPLFTQENSWTDRFL